MAGHRERDPSVKVCTKLKSNLTVRMESKNLWRSAQTFLFGTRNCYRQPGTQISRNFYPFVNLGAMDGGNENLGL